MNNLTIYELGNLEKKEAIMKFHLHPDLYLGCDINDELRTALPIQISWTMSHLLILLLVVVLRSLSPAQ